MANCADLIFFSTHSSRDLPTPLFDEEQGKTSKEMDRP
jgi:hypothetical protein